jgi:hypothetical protein
MRLERGHSIRLSDRGVRLFRAPPKRDALRMRGKSVTVEKQDQEAGTGAFG